MAHRLICVSLDPELAERLDRFATPRRRSAIVARAVAEMLDRELRAEAGQFVHR